MLIEPVAHFSSPFDSKFGAPRQSGLVPELTGEIVFDEPYNCPEALKGIEGFDYLWIVWGFSANRELDSWEPTVRPPRLGGNASVGVFASRSPYRPNPLGLSSVRVVSVDASAGRITVSGADLIDGTPIYDVKPYLPYCDSHPDAAAGYVDSTSWKGLDVIFPEELRPAFSPEDALALEKVLGLDPRPRYQDSSEKKYGLLFRGRDVHFSVSDGVLTVLSID